MIDALVDVIGQRHLHQDAVDRGIGIQPLDEAQELGLRGGVGQVVAHRHEPALLAGHALVAHVDVRGRVVADEHHGEPGPAFAARGEPVAFLANLAPDVRRDGLAVDDPASHAVDPSLSGRAFWHELRSRHEAGLSRN